MNKLWQLWCLVCILGTTIAGPSQVEFVATLKSVESLEETTLLSMELTPEVNLTVVVSEATEIKDETELRATATSLQVGQTLRIQGVFGDTGLVATQIIVTDDNHAFELRGRIQEITPAPAIRIYDFLIQVPESAHIHDQFGENLGFGDLQVEQYVKVSGVVQEGRFLAREIKVRIPEDGFARVRFSGILREFVDDRSFIVAVEGDVAVLVHLTDDTEVIGALLAGVSLYVVGVIGDDLSVKAIKVKVLGLFELIPPRLAMQAGTEKMVQVVLRHVLDEDLRLSLHSTDPEVAMPSSDGVVVEAGKLVGRFVVQAKREGHAAIVASAAGRGEEAVKVQVAAPEPELRIHWRPEKVEVRQGQEFHVRLILNQPAPEDIRVRLEAVEPHISPSGDIAPPRVRFPSEVLIPSGHEGVSVPMQAGFQPGRTLIQAQLANGAASRLLVEVGPADAPLRVGWRPEGVEVRFLREFSVALYLNRPAPVSFRARISASGDPHIVDGMPEAVEFEEGQEKVELRLKSRTTAGRVQFVASLPEDLGGARSALVIEVVGRALRVEFVPGEVEVPFHEEFRVKVVLSHPAPEAFSARLKVVDGNTGIVREIPGRVEFSQGAREAHIGFVSTETAGRLFLRVCLPEDLGGAEDGLVVEVFGGPRPELRIAWSRDVVEVDPETLFELGLLLDPAAPDDFVARLKVVEGNSDLLVEIPEGVRFEEGMDARGLALRTGAHSGRLVLRICLPEGLGGGCDDSVIEIP